MSSKSNKTKDLCIHCNKYFTQLSNHQSQKISCRVAEAERVKEIVKQNRAKKNIPMVIVTGKPSKKKQKKQKNQPNNNDNNGDPNLNIGPPVASLKVNEPAIADDSSSFPPLDDGSMQENNIDMDEEVVSVAGSSVASSIGFTDANEDKIHPIKRPIPESINTNPRVDISTAIDNVNTNDTINAVISNNEPETDTSQQIPIGAYSLNNNIRIIYEDSNVEECPDLRTHDRLDKHELALLRVYDICEKARAPRYTMDVILNIFQEEYNNFDFQHKIWKRDTFIKTIIEKFPCTKPEIHPEDLESDHARDIQYHRIPRNLVSVVTYDPLSQIKDILSDYSLFYDLSNLQINLTDDISQRWKPFVHPDPLVRDDQLTGAWFKGVVSDYQRKYGSTVCILPLVMYIDKTGTDQMQ